MPKFRAFLYFKWPFSHLDDEDGDEASEAVTEATAEEQTLTQIKIDYSSFDTPTQH